MNDQNPDSAADGDAVWTAAARALAGEGMAEEREAFRREAAAHPGRAELLDALDGALQPLAADARSDVDVEAALSAVLARRDERPRLVVEPRSAPVREMAPPPSTVPARWRMPAWLPAAAAAVVLIGAGLLWRTLFRPDAAPAARYATAVGARQTITLPDGSTVQLGPGSRIEVAEGYGEPERALRLEGEAYFEVRHDAAHPFVVRTAAAEVRDLGTAFTVRAGDSIGARVAVTEGSVALKPAAGDGAGQVLAAGDRGSVGADGAVRVERGTVTEDDLAWTRGRLVFRDAPVPEVAAELRRWYGITLVVRDPELAGRHLTASFGGETADEAVRVVAAALGGQLQRHGDTAAVVPR